MCTIQNILYKTGEGVAMGLGHPVEWRDIKTAGGGLPAFYKVRRCDSVTPLDVVTDMYKYIII